MKPNLLSSKSNIVASKRTICYGICGISLIILLLMLTTISWYQWRSIRSLEHTLSAIKSSSKPCQEKNIQELEKELASLISHRNSLQKKKDWVTTITPIIKGISASIPDDVRLTTLTATKKQLELHGQATNIVSIKRFIDALNDSHQQISFSLISLQQSNLLYDNKPLLEFIIKSMRN